MVDLERQIRAWADAHAPDEKTPGAVSADEILTARAAMSPLARSGMWAGRGRWLVAAAVVTALAAVGAIVVLAAADEPERVDVASTDSVPADADPLTGPVGFDVLGVSAAGGLPALGEVEVARTRGELAQLWADAGLAAPMPVIDPDSQVVVAMTIADDACPPTIERFDRVGITITPVFVEPAGGCNQPLIPRTFVVAIEWASVGDSFTLRLPAQEVHELAEVSREVTRPGDPDVVVTWKLDETEFTDGEPISGTVTVDNQSGAPIEGTACGGFFALRLRGPEAEQGVFRPACASPFTLPEGTSTHEVQGWAGHTSCTEAPDPPQDAIVCGPDGTTIPPFPAGTYEALLDQAQPGLVPPPDPIEVTIS